MSLDQTSIYALRDPDSLEVRYVGKANDPDQRLRGHWIGRHTGHTYRNRWLRSLDRKPVMTILETVPMEQWQDAERKWIAYYRSKAARLTNGDNGGLGPLQVTQAVKEKISKTLQGRKLDPEHAAKARTAAVGKRHSGEARKRHSKQSLKMWQEHRSDMCEAMRGVPHPGATGARHPKAKLSAEDVRLIRFLHKHGTRECDLVREFHVVRSTIRRITTGQGWKLAS